jgi:hypothetical protein
MYFLHARRARRQATMSGKIAYAASRSWKAMRHAGYDLAERTHRTSGIVARRLRAAS